MNLRISILLLTTAITAQAGIQYENLATVAVAPCVAALEHAPDSYTATRCAGKLMQLSMTQPALAGTASRQLANLINNLFEGEQRVRRSRAAVSKADQEARDAEVNARHWLQRNVFGSNQPNLYNNAVKSGQQLKARAASSLATAREHFVLMSSASADTVRGLEQAGLSEISRPLSVALQTLVNRTKEPMPGEDGHFSKELVGGLAVLGLLWAGSKLLGEPGAAAENGHSDQSVMQTQRQQEMQQQRRLNNEAEEARQRQAAEQRAIDAQHRAWEMERNRPFN